MITKPKDFYVHTTNLSNTTGILKFGKHVFPCVLGRGGISRFKTEGDGKSPAGVFRLLSVFYRADRISRPRVRLPIRPILVQDGWCDDPDHPNYNRFVQRPFAASHERLMREDVLYDVVIVLDYNIHPCQPGAGSAIFFHIASAYFMPTAGCIAVSHATMHQVLSYADVGSRLWIG